VTGVQTCALPISDASADSDAIVSAIEKADASLLETHVDAHANSDEEEDTPKRRLF
jgi:hypothetical protein